jgi:hypothetical protein
MLIKFLIIFFIILIIYQLILANLIIEGLENKESNNDNYKSYDSNDPLILGQQNAGNIEYLKKRMDDIQGLYQTVQDLSNNYQNLQTQVDDLVLAQKEYTTNMIGEEPPEINGYVQDDTVDSTTFITE